MSGLSIPKSLPAGSVVDKGGMFLPPWMGRMSLLMVMANALVQSGPTAQRPTQDLWPGRPYFDTDLGANGRPIWVNSDASGWVDADGNAI